MPDALARDAQACKAWQLSRFGYLPKTWWLDPSWVCVRLARAAWKASADGSRIRKRLFTQLNSVLTGADVEPDSRIGGGLLVQFPVGVSLWLDAGENVTIGPIAGSGSTILDADRSTAVRAGDNVTLGGFTGVQGSILLGDGCFIAPGGGALKDVAAGQVSDLVRPMRITPTESNGVLSSVRASRSSRCHHRTFAEAVRDWRADLRRLQSESARFDENASQPGLASLAFTNQSIAILLHRLAHWLWSRGLKRASGIFASINRYVFKLTIHPSACLGSGLWLPHLAGTVIRGAAGKNMIGFSMFYAGNSLGPFGDEDEHPVVGDDVLVAAHAGVFDGAAAGDAARVSRKANCQHGIPSGSTAFAEGSIVKTFETIDVPVRSVREFPLPDMAELRAADRTARQSYEREHGRLPLQSRLAVALFRKAQRALMAGHLRRSRWWWLISSYLTGADIAPRSAIGPGLVIVCPAGTSFDGAAIAGLTLVGQCFVGGVLTADRTLCDPRQTPAFGTDVIVKPHVAIYGGCAIGDRVVFEPGSVIRHDVPSDMTVHPPKLRNMSSDGVKG